jgi:lipoprotein-anchoring transpeptidase ErfK/SrfK
MTRGMMLVTLGVIGLAGCDLAGRREDEQPGEAADEVATAYATAYATGSEQLTPEELEAGRLEMDWREWTERDTTALAVDSLSTPQDSAGAASGPARETWDDITMESVNNGPVLLPVHGDVAGPSVLRVQILLDRALFSPGIMDGRWGRNTEKAVFWLQRREGLRATGAVDEQTWERLQQLAGQAEDLIVQRQLTEDDVAGPFVTLPSDYYERRDLDCQCYESLSEKLAERFHTSEETLRKLNDGKDLNALAAGATLNVLAVEPRTEAAGATVASIVISDGGKYLHALDASGRILYHFPATLGSDYSPSPTGDYRVTNIAHDPVWHYQPKLLEGVPDTDPAAVLPAGPNNAVGVVWMQLSKPHYGIHGTSRPETIGYATSNGCVRLTNWDAQFLGGRIAPGTPVRFRDVRGG